MSPKRSFWPSSWRLTRLPSSYLLKVSNFKFPNTEVQRKGQNPSKRQNVVGSQWYNVISWFQLWATVETLCCPWIERKIRPVFFMGSEMGECSTLAMITLTLCLVYLKTGFSLWGELFWVNDNSSIQFLLGTQTFNFSKAFWCSATFPVFLAATVSSSSSPDCQPICTNSWNDLRPKISTH